MKAHHDAAVARLKVAAITDRVYAPNGVPKSPVTPYYVLSCDSGSERNHRGGGQSTSDRYSIVVQAIGETYGELQTALERTDLAFKGRALTVVGFDCTIARREIATTPVRDPDGGSLLVGLHTYVFTSSPA